MPVYLVYLVADCKTVLIMTCFSRRNVTEVDHISFLTMAVPFLGVNGGSS